MFETLLSHCFLKSTFFSLLLGNQEVGVTDPPTTERIPTPAEEQEISQVEKALQEAGQLISSESCTSPYHEILYVHINIELLMSCS